jgi:hypothetical protein
VKTRATLAVALALCWLVLPSIAFAGVWKEGTAATPFSFPDMGGLWKMTNASGDPALTLPYEASTAFTDPSVIFEPRSVRPMADDSRYLVTDGRYPFIYKLSRGGQVVKKYTGADITGLERPFDAFPLDGGAMLVVDRRQKPADIETTGTGRVQWLEDSGKLDHEFSVESGPLAGQMWDPFTAEPAVKGQTTLIADSLGQRVIEIDDRTGVLIWSYGNYKKPGLLNLPHSAQRIASSNDTLICDSANNRVIEVSHSDKRIVWSYGMGTAGAGPGQLNDPNSARRLPNGHTLICDSGNSRVIEVDSHGNIVEAYNSAGRTPSSGVLSEPRAVARFADDGSTIIADAAGARLVRYGYHPRREYVVTSKPIPPPNGKMKWFSRIRVNAVCPNDAHLAAEYCADGREWFDIPVGGALPSTTQGSAIRYRLRLTADKADAAPVVNDVSITWSDTAPTSGKSTSKSGTSSGTSKSATAKTNTTASTATGRAVSSGGTGQATAGGSGSQNTTTVAPGGGSSSIGGGVAGGPGSSGGSGVQPASARSGWVMSEVMDDVGGATGLSGTGSLAPVGAMGQSSIPGVALMFVAYSIGLAWSPASKLAIRIVVAAMAH